MVPQATKNKAKDKGRKELNGFTRRAHCGGIPNLVRDMR